MKIYLTKEERKMIEGLSEDLGVGEIKHLISDKDSIEFPSYLVLGWLNSLKESMSSPLGFVLKSKFTIPLKNHIRGIVNNRRR